MNVDLGVISSVVLAIGVIIGGVVWLARLEGKADAAAKEIETIQKVVIPELKARLDRVEAHKSEVAALSAQMVIVLERLKELSLNIQALMSSHLRDN